MSKCFPTTSYTTPQAARGRLQLALPRFRESLRSVWGRFRAEGGEGFPGFGQERRCRAGPVQGRHPVLRPPPTARLERVRAGTGAPAAGPLGPVGIARTRGPPTGPCSLLTSPWRRRPPTRLGTNTTPAPVHAQRVPRARHRSLRTVAQASRAPVGLAAPGPQHPGLRFGRRGCGPFPAGQWAGPGRGVWGISLSSSREGAPPTCTLTQPSLTWQPLRPQTGDKAGPKEGSEEPTMRTAASAIRGQQGWVPRLEEQRKCLFFLKPF